MAKYHAGAREICPHCHTAVVFEHPTLRPYSNDGMPQPVSRYSGKSEMVTVTVARCTSPECGRLVVTLEVGPTPEVAMKAAKTTVDMLEVAISQWAPSYATSTAPTTFVAWPLFGNRPVPAEVPEHIAQDYHEAVRVLSLSPKASAALSRRCLQALLRDKGFNQHDLWQQIAAVADTLPVYIREDVDAIRQFGNFAAHPAHDIATGEIIDVEEGEAEWTLDVLDDLFDFFYAQPAASARKRAALEVKLQAAGKKVSKKVSK